MKVAFIGLGTMGLPMARQLVTSGFDVAGWDVDTVVGEAFEHSADSLEYASKDADAIITMLPEGQHVRSVYESILAAGDLTNCLFLDCSTIDIETTRSLSEKVKANGHEFVDAPVSGGAEGAAIGTLSFMLGGEKGAIIRARPLLSAMGSKITEFGAAGSGQAAKACHNMICGITALGVCEAFALAESLGLDTHQFFDLCKGAAAQSWILENRCPVPGPALNAPSSNDYAPGFAARLMAKDLRLAQSAALSSGQSTPFGKQAAERFSEFANDGGGELDFSAIYRSMK